MEADIQFMREAMVEARAAAAAGEVPIGAVLVHDGKILARSTLYVTIEPCSMCAGAVIQARVPRLVYGADDSKGGAVRSCFEILSHPRLNHQVEVAAGVLAIECAAIIQSFFAERR